MVTSSILCTPHEAPHVEDAFGSWIFESPISNARSFCKSNSSSNTARALPRFARPTPASSSSSVHALHYLQQVEAKTSSVVSSLSVVNSLVAAVQKNGGHNGGAAQRIESPLPTCALPALVNLHSAEVNALPGADAVSNHKKSPYAMPEPCYARSSHFARSHGGRMLSEQISKGTERLLAKVSTMNKNYPAMHYNLRTPSPMQTRPNAKKCNEALVSME